MTITSLKSALQRIAQLEQENEQLRAELEVYKNRNTGGRKKHDEAWMTSYRDFAVLYARMPGERAVQIGRASCRERV